MAACANTILHAVSEDSSANVMVVAIAAVPVVLWFNVGNVQFVNVPLAGVPNTGVTNEGLVANTNTPVPVSSEILPAKLADVPDANPVIGNPVQDVKVPPDGVPNTGVTKVGLVANTNDPLPVSSDIAVANSAEDPVNVLSVKSILLFVNVVVEDAVTVVPADDIIS